MHILEDSESIARVWGMCCCGLRFPFMLLLEPWLHLDFLLLGMCDRHGMCCKKGGIGTMGTGRKETLKMALNQRHEDEKEKTG